MNLFDMLFAAKVNGGGGGGGSANSKETYTGTLDGFETTLAGIYQAKYEDRFVPMSRDNERFLRNDFYNGNVSGVLNLDFSQIVAGAAMTVPLVALSNATDETYGFYAGVTNGEVTSAMQMNITFYVNGSMGAFSTVGDVTYRVSMQGSTVDITPYLSAIPYTLTLYWHEMPN